MGDRHDDGERPAEVIWAWRVMVAQVGLGLVGIAVTLLTVDTLRRYLRDERVATTAAELDQAVNGALGSAVVTGLVFAGFWLWLADRVRHGRPWARTATLVLAGIGIAFGLMRLATGQPPVVRVLDVAGLLLDAAVVALLVRLPAQAYFRRPERYRAPARRRPVS